MGTTQKNISKAKPLKITKGQNNSSTNNKKGSAIFTPPRKAGK